MGISLLVLVRIRIDPGVQILLLRDGDTDLLASLADQDLDPVGQTPMLSFGCLTSSFFEAGIDPQIESSRLISWHGLIPDKNMRYIVMQMYSSASLAGALRP